MKTFKAPSTSRIVHLNVPGVLDPVQPGQTIAVFTPLRRGGADLPKELQVETPITAPIRGCVYIKPTVHVGSLIEQGDKVFFVLSEKETAALKNALRHSDSVAAP